jgi:hypothetical protein
MTYVDYWLIAFGLCILILSVKCGVMSQRIKKLGEWYYGK